MTGGINRPLKVSDTLIRFMLDIEEVLPKFVMKRIASRCMIVIKHK